MTKAYLIAAVSFGVFAAPPVQAQLLGGGGVIGGQLGGTLSSTAGPLSTLPRETLRSSTRSTARADTRTTGSQRVDRRQGTVTVDRSLEGSLDAAGAQLLQTPAGSSSATGSGSGSAAGSGSANAQLIGTDAVRDVSQRTAGQARDVISVTRQRANGLSGSARSLSGPQAAGGGASGEGAGSIGSGMLAAAGSGAAAGEGAFAVTPGMPVVAPDGRRFGKVRQLISDSRGRVTSVLVQTKDRDVAVPAASLSGSGSALLMGESAAATADPQPTGN